MADRELLARLQGGVTGWNAWRIRAQRVALGDLWRSDLTEADLTEAKLLKAVLLRADLSDADLSDADLSDADLKGANLEGATLKGADLEGADLRWATLWRSDLGAASLTRAGLTGADLTGARLAGADLTGADLRWTVLWKADLRGANLTEAGVQGTVFADLDLSGAVGLETVRHFGPSTIGVDTLYRSGGRIPELFLRGAGVPEIVIAYVPSLAGRPFEYATCFISHSGKDRRFCDRLHADLQARGVRVWYFYEDARWGEPVWGEIDQSIRRYDKLVVVCSRDALGSGPVLRELERALQREDREGKNILFPIRIDDYLFDGWEHARKADVVAKVAGDFRGWQRSSATYAKAFDRFLQALQADAAPRSA